MYPVRARSAHTLPQHSPSPFSHSLRRTPQGLPEGLELFMQFTTTPQRQMFPQEATKGGREEKPRSSAKQRQEKPRNRPPMMVSVSSSPPPPPTTDPSRPIRPIYGACLRTPPPPMSFLTALSSASRGVTTSPNNSTTISEKVILPTKATVNYIYLSATNLSLLRMDRDLKSSLKSRTTTWIHQQAAKCKGLSFASTPGEIFTPSPISVEHCGSNDAEDGATPSSPRNSSKHTLNLSEILSSTDFVEVNYAEFRSVPPSPRLHGARARLNSRFQLKAFWPCLKPLLTEYENEVQPLVPKKRHAASFRAVGMELPREVSWDGTLPGQVPPLSWNARWQDLMDEPWTTVPESIHWLVRVRKLVDSFVEATLSTACRITKGEVGDSIEIQPGIYVLGDVVFKTYTTPSLISFLGGSSQAMKIGGHARKAFYMLLKIARSHRTKGTHTFSVPLCYTLTLYGVRIMVSARMPISSTTSLSHEDEIVQQVTKSIGHIVRLKVKPMNIITQELKFHRSKDDGRLYISDAYRLIPPTRPGEVLPQAFLHQRFRPEMLLQSEIKLSSDAFSNKMDCFRQDDDQEVVKVSACVISRMIPDFIRSLAKAKTVEKGDKLCKILHRKGINLRSLGLVASGLMKEISSHGDNITQSESIITATMLTQYLNAVKGEMVCRAFRDIANAKLGSLPRPLDEAATMETCSKLAYLLLHLGRQTKTNIFWLEELLPCVRSKFGFSGDISFKTLSRRDLKNRVEQLLGWSIVDVGETYVTSIEPLCIVPRMTDLPSMEDLKGASIVEACSAYEQEVQAKSLTGIVSFSELLLRYGEVLLLSGQTRHYEAEKVLQSALEIHYAEVIPENAPLYFVHSMLGSLKAMQYQIAEAVRYFETAIMLADEIHYDSETLLHVFQKFILVLKEVESEKGRAIHYAERSLVIAQDMPQLDPVTLRRVRYIAVELLTSVAVEGLTKELIPPRMVKISHGRVLVDALGDLANDVLNKGDFTAAKSIFERQLCIARLYFGFESVLTAAAMDNCAVIYKSYGSHIITSKLLTDSWSTKVNALGERHVESLIALVSLAIAQCKEGLLEEGCQKAFTVLILLRRLADTVPKDKQETIRTSCWGVLEKLSIRESKEIDDFILFARALDVKSMVPEVTAEGRIFGIHLIFADGVMIPSTEDIKTNLVKFCIGAMNYNVIVDDRQVHVLCM